MMAEANSSSISLSGGSLKGADVLVTGGTSGIGICFSPSPFLSLSRNSFDQLQWNAVFRQIFNRHAVVEELAGLGAAVYTCSRQEADLEKCLREWRDKGFIVTGSVCNGSDRAQREQLTEKVSSIFNGKLNMLVGRYYNFVGSYSFKFCI